MLIGEAPGQREDAEGRAFVGRAGQLLDRMLGEVGLSRDDLYITNVVHCRPPNNRSPTRREISACMKWLNYEVSMIKPKIIALLGNVALKAMLGLKGIKKLRGRPIERDGVTYLPMYHPSYILRGDNKDLPTGIADLRTLKDIIEYGGVPEERDLRPTLVDTWPKVEQMLAALTGSVSVDIETTTLYPWAKDARVVMFGFGTRAGEFDVPAFHKDSPWTDKDISRIVELATDKLEDTINVYHNGKYDCLWMKVHYGVNWRNDFDTLLAHYLIDENSLHGLEFLARLYFGAPNWDIPLEEKQGNAPLPKLAKYHAHDLFYTRKLFFELSHELKDKQIKRVFRHILMPAANLFVHMEHRGCYIDATRMDEAERWLRSELTKAELALNKWGKINWGSPKQVGKLLYNDLSIKCPQTTRKGAPSTSESALNQIDHPAVADLIRYRGHRQQLSFFVEGWRPYIVNSRIHPSFKLHGTVTGRPSCEHPNFQQVPRDTRIRSQITAPTGWTLVEADLSQIELRLAAELSRVPSMMEAFRTGLDIHWKTALGELERYAGQRELVLATARAAQGSKTSYAEGIEILRKMGPDAAIDIDPAWKEIRKRAKAVSFGYLYGMWHKKFRIYARDNYGIVISDEEARKSREAFFDLYPLTTWHHSCQRIAADYGYVRTMTGRKRRLPHAQDGHDSPERAEAWRQAINSPIQGTASDLNLMVLLELASAYPRTVVKPIITVHDAILAEVRDDYVERVATRLLEIMRSPVMLKIFDIHFAVPICGEVKLGPWGSGVSLERWRRENAGNQK